MRWLVFLGVVTTIACDSTHHCGSPPQDCLGGTCSNGACTAWRVATGVAEEPTGLGLDGDELYFTTSPGDLFVIPETGVASTPSPIPVTTFLPASELAFDATSIYVASQSGLFRVDRTSHAVSVLDPAYASDVATDASGDVYWSTIWDPNGQDGIKRLRAGATTPEVLTNETSEVLALDAAGAYWFAEPLWGGCWMFCSDPCANAQFPLRASFNGGPPVTLGIATPSANSLAADGEALYVADRCAGTLTRIGHEDGVTTVIATGLESPGAIALDASYVYVVLSGRVDTDWFGNVTVKTPGGIVRVPKVGGPSTPLAIASQLPNNQIAVGDAAAYFIAHPIENPTSAKAAIHAIAKPRP